MLVDRVDIGLEGADVRLKLEGLSSLAPGVHDEDGRAHGDGGMNASTQTMTVRVPLAVRKWGGRKPVAMPASVSSNSNVDSTLVKALARAFRWRGMMEAERYATINELAAAERINSSYVSRLVRLTLLAPDLVEAILDGRQPEEMTLPGLMEPFPTKWNLQKQEAAD